MQRISGVWKRSDSGQETQSQVVTATPTRLHRLPGSDKRPFFFGGRHRFFFWQDERRNGVVNRSPAPGQAQNSPAKETSLCPISNN